MKRIMFFAVLCIQLLFYSCSRSVLMAPYKYAGGTGMPKSLTSFFAHQVRCEDEWKYLPLESPSSLRVLYFEPGFGICTLHFPDLLIGTLPSGDTVRLLNKETGKFSKFSKKHKLLLPEPLIYPGDVIGVEQDSSVTSKLPLLANQKGIEGLHTVGCHRPGVTPFDSLTIGHSSICSIQIEL